MSKFSAIVLATILAVTFVGTATAKPILCKKMGKTTPVAFFREGRDGITYTTNFPRSYMVYFKKTKKCRVFIKLR